MKNKFVQLLSGIFSFLFLLISCDQQAKQQSSVSTETTEIKKEEAKNLTFQADSAYAFIAKQVSFGPRIPNTTAHVACGNYLVNTIKRYGAKVQEQTFEKTAHDGKTLQLRNIIAQYNPEAANRILLAAHWDTRPIADKDENDPQTPADGANDGGSGVGVLLEIARVLNNKNNNPGVGVDIIFFDGEDYGKDQEDAGSESSWCYGSQYWSKNKVPANYTATF